MKHTGESTEFARRRIDEDKSPTTAEPLRATQNEEWAWMVDEDPAFYLSKAGGVEAAGA